MITTKVTYEYRIQVKYDYEEGCGWHDDVNIYSTIAEASEAMLDFTSISSCRACRIIETVVREVCRWEVSE